MGCEWTRQDKRDAIAKVFEKANVIESRDQLSSFVMELDGLALLVCALCVAIMANMSSALAIEPRQLNVIGTSSGVSGKANALHKQQLAHRSQNLFEILSAKKSPSKSIEEDDDVDESDDTANAAVSAADTKETKVDDDGVAESEADADDSFFLDLELLSNEDVEVLSRRLQEDAQLRDDLPPPLSNITSDTNNVTNTEVSVTTILNGLKLYPVVLIALVVFLNVSIVLLIGVNFVVNRSVCLRTNDKDRASSSSSRLLANLNKNNAASFDIIDNDYRNLKLLKRSVSAESHQHQHDQLVSTSSEQPPAAAAATATNRRRSHEPAGAEYQFESFVQCNRSFDTLSVRDRSSEKQKQKQHLLLHHYQRVDEIRADDDDDDGQLHNADGDEDVYGGDGGNDSEKKRLEERVDEHDESVDRRAEQNEKDDGAEEDDDDDDGGFGVLQPQLNLFNSVNSSSRPTQAPSEIKLQTFASSAYSTLRVNRA